ncbi:MAG: hypothetical protein D6781_01195 [Verrucomicrobia bacterium]|nr:MAG: hypothetical protein D6781_01195 [Verrucomicrobiota bacterium]
MSAEHEGRGGAPEDQLVAVFQRLGAPERQARVMAAQTWKRAGQIARERGIPETEALAGLLEKIVAGVRGTYSPDAG